MRHTIYLFQLLNTHTRKKMNRVRRGEKIIKKKRTEEPNAKKPRESRNWCKEGGEIIPHQTPRTTRSQPTNQHPGSTEQPWAKQPVVLYAKNKGTEQRHEMKRVRGRDENRPREEIKCTDSLRAKSLGHCHSPQYIQSVCTVQNATPFICFVIYIYIYIYIYNVWKKIYNEHRQSAGRLFDYCFQIKERLR